MRIRSTIEDMLLADVVITDWGQGKTVEIVSPKAIAYMESRLGGKTETLHFTNDDPLLTEILLKFKIFVINDAASKRAHDYVKQVTK